MTWSDTPMVHVTCTYQRSSHDKATGCSCTCGCSQLPVVNAKTFSIMAQSTSEAKSLFHKKLSVKLLVFVASRAVELLFFGCHCCNSQPKRNRPPLFDIQKQLVGARGLWLGIRGNHRERLLWFLINESVQSARHMCEVYKLYVCVYRGLFTVIEVRMVNKLWLFWFLYCECTITQYTT